MSVARGRLKAKDDGEGRRPLESLSPSSTPELSWSYRMNRRVSASPGLGLLL